MLAAVMILVFAIFTIFFIPAVRPEPEPANEDAIKKDPQLKKLWSLAQSAMKERKPLKAEKALLTILKFDEKNAAAYNRLGILYAKEKHYKEAIECFEIAQSLDNNASSLHNVGLIYFETGKYEKAAMAFSQAIALEGDQPARYIAYAKALEKLGERSKAVEALETAYSLNPSTVVLRHLLELYENAQDAENIEITKRRIEDLQLKKAEMEAKAAARNRKNILSRTTTKKPKPTAAERTAAKTQRAEAKAQARANKAANRKPVIKNIVRPITRPKTISPNTTASAQAPHKVAKKRKII